MAEEKSPIELSDMLVGLRRELQEAQKKAEKENLKFKVESIDVEAQVTVVTDAKLKGNAKWKFFLFGEAGVEAEAGVSRGSVQTIKLTMTPLQEDGGSTMISKNSKRPN